MAIPGNRDTTDRGHDRNRDPPLSEQEKMERAVKDDPYRALWCNIACSSSGIVPDSEKLPQVALMTSGFLLTRYQKFEGPKCADYLCAMLAIGRVPSELSAKLVKGPSSLIYPFGYKNEDIKNPFDYKPIEIKKPKYQGIAGQVTAHLGYLAYTSLVKPITDENKQYIVSRLSAMRSSSCGALMLDNDHCEDLLDLDELNKLNTYIMAKGLKSQLILCFLSAGVIGAASVPDAQQTSNQGKDLITMMNTIPDLSSKLCKPPVRVCDRVFTKCPLNAMERGYFGQWNMTTSGLGMNAIDRMVEFCTESHALALLHGGVCKEVMALTRIYDRFNTLYGPMMRYMRVLELPGCEELQNSNFPNLYTCAMEWFRATLSPEQAKQYKITAVKTVTSNIELKRLALQPIRGFLQLGGANAAALREHGGADYSLREIKAAIKSYSQKSDTRIDLDYVPARPAAGETPHRAGTDTRRSRKRRNHSSGSESDDSSDMRANLRRMEEELRELKARNARPQTPRDNRRDRSRSPLRRDSRDR